MSELDLLARMVYPCLIDVSFGRQFVNDGALLLPACGLVGLGGEAVHFLNGAPSIHVVALLD